MVTRIKLSIRGREASRGPVSGPHAAPTTKERAARASPILVPNTRFLVLDTPQTEANIGPVPEVIHKGWPGAGPGTILKSDE